MASPTSLTAFLDQVLDKLPATPQRRHAWQARRSTPMSNFLKIAVAAAAVVVVGVAGLSLLPRSSVPGVGAAPTSSPTPTPTVGPTPSTIPLLPSEGSAIEPGRYRLVNAAMTGNVSIQVPAGWTVESGDMVAKNRGFKDNDAGVSFAFWPITGTLVDLCTDHTLVEPAPGPGIDELADALAEPARNGGRAARGRDGRRVRCTACRRDRDRRHRSLFARRLGVLARGRRLVR